tara:strand:+ start:5604 stop:7364 length:1761 start_codon:yes stop_codon:yes gene_type:complete
MATLTGKKVSESYKDLLQVSNSNSGVDATLRTVEDGEGTSAGVQLSTTDTSFNGNHILNEQGRQNHVVSTMPSPYYHFDGTNDYISLADDDRLSFSPKLSISIWFKCKESTISGGEVLINKYNGTGSNREYTLYFGTDEKLNIGISPTGGDDAVGRATPVLSNLDKWNHAVVVWDSDYSTGTIKIYINGIDQGTLTGSGTIPTVMANKTSILTIGANASGADNFTGDIGQVQLWNIALSASQVKDLYSGKSVEYKYQGSPNTELITNGTMEADSNWADRGTVTGSRSTEQVKTGTYSRKVYATATNIGGWGIDSDTFTTVAGKQYRLSFWVYPDDDTHMRILLHDGGGSAIYNNDGTGILDNLTQDAWNHIEYDFVSVTGGSSAQVKLMYKDGQNGTIYFDDVSVKQLGCTLELDGSGVASDKWLDKSGNDLHGTLGDGSDATKNPALANAPSGDDGLVYEEGDFTPAIKFGSGTTGITYHANTVGKYYRIGNTVFITANIKLTSKGSSSGNARVTGLPYSVNSGAELSGFVMPYWTFTSGSHTGLQGSGTEIALYDKADAGSVDYITDGDFADTTEFGFSGTFNI